MFSNPNFPCESAWNCYNVLKMSDLQVKLDKLTRKGELWEAGEEGKVRCLACAHRCLIQPGKRGICQVRFNRGGELFAPWGYVAGAHADPIEKKPFAHFLPGAKALTFGMLGCNLRCDFCQNWQTSQTLRDSRADAYVGYLEQISPEEVVSLALQTGSEVIASSYNEPLITAEWAAAIFKIARERGIRTVFVSNGYGSADVLEYLRPLLDGMKIDLKAMSEKGYQRLGGKLQPVLDTIRLAREKGFWVEVVTLLIPGFNDDPQELWDLAAYLASVSRDIPWHVTAYHPDYDCFENPPTRSEDLQRAADIGQEAGLNYVYAGNLPGRVGSLEDTLCPKCNAFLVKRRGYAILDYRISTEGKCPNCATPIAGVWRTGKTPG
jgi:pyruvate formate lyase activating enzyme